MLPNARRREDLQEAESVGTALNMTMVVRSQIFSCEVIEPASRAFIRELDNRLDQVPARRHAVDFEVAKAKAYWTGKRADELIDLGRKTLAADPEVQRAKALEQPEAIIFDRHLVNLLKAEISRKLEFQALQMKRLRDCRLNVQ